jgi:hypothetical protein
MIGTDEGEIRLHIMSRLKWKLRPEELAKISVIKTLM